MDVAVDYVKGLLSVAAGILFVLIGPGLLIGLRATAQGKATGIGVIWGAIPEALLSFRFWIPALLLAGFFWAASRLGIKALRVLLFWIPTIAVIAMGVGFFVLFAFVHFGLGRR